MPTLSRSVSIEAPAERVFAYVDDIRNLACHMTNGTDCELPCAGIWRTIGWALVAPTVADAR